MTTTSTGFPVDADSLSAAYQRNRRVSAMLFDLIRPQAYFDRPIPLRHPFAFYEGHLPAFSFLVTSERALGEAPIDPRLEALFERGIDPGSLEAADSHARTDWPSREEIRAFAAQCDERVLRSIANGPLADDTVPRLVRGQAFFTALEHEHMHHETLIYIIHQLPDADKRRIVQEHRDAAPPHNDFVEIAPGGARLGAQRDRIAFGWDNEFDAHEVFVERFAVQRYPVTNGDYLKFVRAGGPMPPFWIERDGELRLRCVFEELPLPLSWPVYVSNQDARTYAAWHGWRLMSEAEYQRAAYGSPSGDERTHPWGEAQPNARHGNFDYARFDPEPVDAHPDGASSWGVHQLVGNGWEWTGTPLAPFDGFEPMASYPQYTADFFDGKHYVLKGASPVTARELIRPSLRNWFYGDYPYMYAKFRCVSS